ncbi:MAG: hypothetical protein B6244_05700 [Candidatus Cloacimonetes bacterium 4572_55]|nr:MAG: hypothetical protein B6244_05700 [Candidatus Cloacimonetes bacterium 4572_55]
MQPINRKSLPFPIVNVVLYEPEIPPNTGNIGRTVLGINGRLYLVGRLGFSVDEYHLKRAGLDYWSRLSVRRMEDPNDLHLDDKRFFLFTKGAKTPYFSATFRLGDYLIFGSESRGLPQELLDQYPDRTLQFPTIGQIRSYNLASSVHSACMELVRQNHAILHPYYRRLEREKAMDQ